MSVIKCFKCRSVLLEASQVEVLTAHGKVVCDEQSEGDVCDSVTDNMLLYLNHDLLPEWIMSKVEESGWMKGKLHCVQCRSKVGSFDFVSGRHCGCPVEELLPAVHFIKSQVDLKKMLDLRLQEL